MLFADDVRVEKRRVRRERINRRVNSEFHDLTRKRGYGVKVRERRRGRGIGVIVRRNVNGLNRSDSAGFRRSDAFLHLAHFRRQVRLITDRRRHTSEQRGHFRTGLRKAENVVNEEQHVVSLIAEIFGNRQTRQRNAQTRSRRFGHLPVNQSHFRSFDRAFYQLSSNRTRRFLPYCD
jgi:hypothetical protein